MGDREFRLDADCELRFEVEGRKNNVELTLTCGKAEIFGTELAPNKKYIFSSGAKIAVFTWQGCTINLCGETEGTYIARETPMMMYLNTHASLERLRCLADENQSKDEFKRGPVTMVVGPSDVGKSTLCRILLNYAVRRGRRPIFADLDVGLGSIGIPGSIGSVLVERAASAEEGFSQEAPLVYHFGHLEPRDNMTLYNVLVSKIASVVHQKMTINRKVAASGVVINTSNWSKDQEDGYKSLQNVAQAFEVDVIIVLDQERLYNDLIRDIPFIKVVFLPKSGGVVERTRPMRMAARDDKIKEYFYGLRTKYHPHVFQVSYSEFQIYKIGTPTLPDSCMPVGMKQDESKTKLVYVEPGPKLKHSILAITMADTKEEVLTANIAGFICINEVDDQTQRVTVLSPQPQPLPKAFYIQSDILFIDSS